MGERRARLDLLVVWRRWSLAGALAVAGGGGCAAPGVSAKDVARLPVADRAQIRTAHQSIDVATTHLEAAKLGRGEAKQFRKIAARELDAASSRLEAASGAIDLARSARDDRALRDAWRQEDAARAELVSARAKLVYAERLVELRDAKSDEADANLTAARADVEMTKLRLVERHGVADPVAAGKLGSRWQHAQERLAQSRALVAQLEGDVARLEVAWNDCRHELNIARADRSGQVAPLAPPAAGSAPPRRWRDDPRGEVNDTPAAPEQEESQPPPDQLAPAP